MLVVVLGCYRTGSSAVAGVLHKLGVFMGERFDRPDIHNPQGYWEDLEFKSLHRRIVAGEDVHEEYVQLVNKRQFEHEKWGVKDPFLRKYNILSKLVEGSDPVQVVRTHRPNKDVYNSIMRVIGSPSSEQKRIVSEGVAKYNTELDETIDRLCQERQFLVEDVYFDVLMEEPRDTIIQLSKFVDSRDSSRLEAAIAHVLSRSPRGTVENIHPASNYIEDEVVPPF